MKNKPLFISIAVFAVLAAIFGISDLAISEKIMDPQSGWAHFMEAYGQLPGALVGFLGSSVLLRLIKLEKSFKSILSLLGLSIIVLFTGFLFWGDALGQQVGADVNYLLALGLSLFMLIVAQVWLRRISDETMQSYRSFGQIAALLFFLAGVVTVWSIKIPWGRWTYRDILEAGDMSLFTPWYLPQGNNGHHSFISGHTALSFCVLPIVILFMKNKKSLKIAWVLAITWGVIGAASRVVVGAHFASDVLFAAGQTLLWFWILRKKFLQDAV
jgi:membrane-associated phospholipid phosphatase